MSSKRKVKFADSVCWACKAEHTLITDNARGDTVCSGCGMVHQSRLIVESSEARTSYGDGAEEDNLAKKRSSSGDDNSLENSRFFFEGGNEDKKKILGRASFQCEDEKLKVFIGLMQVVAEISQSMHLVKSYTVREEREKRELVYV